MYKIAIVGTFDLANFGDLLFPLLAERELSKRHAVQVVPYSFRDMDESTWLYGVRSLERLPAEIGDYDLLLVGGGYLIRFDPNIAAGYGSTSSDVHQPTGFWFSPTLLAAMAGVPVVWNGVGVAPRIPHWALPLLAWAVDLPQEVAVRDRGSLDRLAPHARRPVRLIPDTAFALRDLISQTDLSAADRLLAELQIDGPFIIVQGSPRLRPHRDELNQAVARVHAAGTAVLELPVSLPQGDGPDALSLGEEVRRPSDWVPPRTLAALVSKAEAVVAYSYHLTIAGLTAGVPVHRFPGAPGTKYEAIQTYAGVALHEDGGATLAESLLAPPRTRGPFVDVLEARAQLDVYWDSVSELLGSRVPPSGSARAASRLMAAIQSGVARAEAGLEDVSQRARRLDQVLPDLERFRAAASEHAEARAHLETMNTHLERFQVSSAAANKRLVQVFTTPPPESPSEDAGEPWKAQYEAAKDLYEAERRAAFESRTGLLRDLRERDRALAAERDRHLQLLKRRSVRLALWFAKLFRPLFLARERLTREELTTTERPARPRANGGHSPHALPSLALDWPEPSPQNLKPWLRLAPEFDAQGTLRRLEDRPPVTVVIPVHNGGATTVGKCLHSVLRHTRGARILIVDDASTDPEVIDLLDQIDQEQESVSLSRHLENLGYTSAINHGLEEAPGDVVLLNSDTEVGPMWLQRLRLVAYSRPKVATVTAVSDNAGAFSLPVVGKPNEYPPWLEWDEIARLYAGSMPVFTIQSPTGSGFCMFITAQAIEAVGGFDADLFPRGYGEENDFCMRAQKVGFANLVAPHVMVRHVRSQSFGTEREELVRQGRQTVDERHPDYTAEVRAFLEGPLLATATKWAERIRQRAYEVSTVRPRALYVLHQASGGTPATNADLLQELEATQESFLLVSNGSQLELQRFADGEAIPVDRWRPAEPFHPTDTWRDDYAEWLARALVGFNIEWVHVRHLIMHPLTLPRVCGLLGIPLVVSAHDFYFVCPTVHLLDDQEQFCGGTCTPGLGRCLLPTPWVEQVPSLKHQWIHTWKENVRRDVWPYADFVVCTSQSAADVLLDVYRQELPPLRVIEHGREMSIAPRNPRTSNPAAPLRIMAPANWDTHKGLDLVKQVAEIVGAQVEWHFFGKRSRLLSDYGIDHGEYNRGHFEHAVKAIDPDLVGIFSIWPETYNHVLTEAWAAGVPALATELGAVAERMREHGGGWLVPPDSPVAVARRILELDQDREAIDRAWAAVPGWSAIRTRAEMAHDYRKLYRAVRNAPGDQSSSKGSQPEIGYIVRGRRNQHPASAYVRVISRVLHPVAREAAQFVRTDPLRAAQNRALGLDAVLVQRDAVPPESVDELLSQARQQDVRLIMELDDDFVTDEGRSALMERGYTVRRLDAAQKVLRRSETVIVSTPALAERVEAFGKPVEVIPNALDERLWLPRLPETGRTSSGERSAYRILYMGSVTHEEDLMVVREALAGLKIGELPVILEVVGGVSPGHDHRWFLQAPPMAAAVEQPAFVRWLRSMRGRWDLAIAPLAETPLNACKSDLKILEYTLLECPVVASEVGPYSGLHDRIRLVSNSTEAWRTAVVESLLDRDASTELWGRANEWVLRERMLGTNMRRWLETVLNGS